MNTLEIILNERDFNYKIFKKINDGETSEIFLGEFNGRKSIFKLTKRNNFNLIINEYLKSGVIENISKKNVTPNILFYEKKIGLLIYEYIEIESKNKILKNIQSIGEQLKKFHQIKFNKRTKTYKDQFNLYINKLNSESKNNYLKEAIELFNDLKMHENENENVFSHNDLNANNILMSKNNIFFIDFEYSSINNKYFDISKIIDSLNLNNSEISKFLFGYGIEGNTKEVNKKIKRWSLMNTYTELIWAKYINKFNKNFLNEAYLKLLASKIKQQKL
uniref:Predicted LicA choline kinase n=1 Tax=uncultured gamma proteobacterium eBACHOT4E07 TaxID=279908 RepID=Q6IVN5_9GAMM|nr:predicted LicA choline kinase [uncultured gamma proteobacterium eBACHOT4E07]